MMQGEATDEKLACMVWRYAAHAATPQESTGRRPCVGPYSHALWPSRPMPALASFQAVSEPRAAVLVVSSDTAASATAFCLPSGSILVPSPVSDLRAFRFLANNDRAARRRPRHSGIVPMSIVVRHLRAWNGPGELRYQDGNPSPRSGMGGFMNRQDDNRMTTVSVTTWS